MDPLNLTVIGLAAVSVNATAEALAIVMTRSKSIGGAERGVDVGYELGHVTSQGPVTDQKPEVVTAEAGAETQRATVVEAQRMWECPPWRVG